MKPEENSAQTPSAAGETKNLAKLVVEGGIPVLYKGSWVVEIPFDRDEITLGVMDPENDIYPDINLRQYRLEGGDPYISRRHARFTCSEGHYYIEDTCKNNSTSLDSKNNIVNGEKKEIHIGSKLFISESVVFRLEATTEADASRVAKPFIPKKIEVQQDATPKYYLEVEKEVPLFFKPRNIFTNIIELNPQEWDNDPRDNKKALQIGRRSTEDGIYPDIDLWKFYFNDGDEYIARRHARIFEDNGKIYFQDLSGKGSTWCNSRDEQHRLVKSEANAAIYEIKKDDRLIVSDSAVFIVHEQQV